MKSKLVKIILIAFISLVIILLIVNPQGLKESVTESEVAESTPRNGSGQSYSTVPQLPKRTFEDVPESAEIEIDGIRVDNFFAEPDPATQSIEVVHIKDTESFQITYINRYNEFLISIQASPFDLYRAQAESQFLSSLDISKEEACKLNVKITTPLYANPDEAGIEYRPGFCR